MVVYLLKSRVYDFWYLYVCHAIAVTCPVSFAKLKSGFYLDWDRIFHHLSFVMKLTKVFFSLTLHLCAVHVGLINSSLSVLGHFSVSTVICSVCRGVERLSELRL